MIWKQGWALHGTNSERAESKAGVRWRGDHRARVLRLQPNVALLHAGSKPCCSSRIAPMARCVPREMRSSSGRAAAELLLPSLCCALRAAAMMASRGLWRGNEEEKEMGQAVCVIVLC